MSYPQSDSVHDTVSPKKTHLEAECDIDLSPAERVFVSYEQGFGTEF